MIVIGNIYYDFGIVYSLPCKLRIKAFLILIFLFILFIFIYFIYFFYLKDPISQFHRYLNEQIKKNENKKYKDILVDYQHSYKVTTKQLETVLQKTYKIISVEHRLDLANKYLNIFVTCSDIENNNDNVWKIIDKNQSIIMKCNDICVGAIIRDIAKQEVANYFGNKMMMTVKVHNKLRRGISHADSGKLVGHGLHADRIDPKHSISYVYSESNLDPHKKKIYDQDGNSFGKWLYQNAHNYLPWTMKSYEDFKEKVKLDDDELIGAVFCAKNYEAVGHRDNDRSEWAVGFCYDTEPIGKGYFIYPEYGIAIEMTSNALWCWKPQFVHGTARLDLNGGTRYTSAITLTERTASAIEFEKGLK